MRNGVPVVDSDGHTYEPEHLYDDYLDPQFRTRVETVGQMSMGKWIRRVDGRLTGADPATLSPAPADLSGPLTHGGLMAYLLSHDVYAERFGDAFLSGWEGGAVARAQLAEGVDISVVYGPGYDFWFKDMDPELAAGMCRAYSRWLAQYREDSGGVIHGSAPLPIYDVKLAIAELEYAYNECEMRAFWARPNPVCGRLVGDREYDPLYEAIQDLDVPFALHTFSGSDLPAAGDDRAVCGWIDGHVYLHPYEQQMAMVDMINRGVFDRFPRLRVGYMEAGSAWVGWLLHRLEEHQEFARWADISGLEHEPVDYFRRNCFVTTECEEKFVHHAIEAVGDDNIMFATDYPHVDEAESYPGYVDDFLAKPQLSDESKNKIMWHNAQRFYKFEAKYIPAAAGGERQDDAVLAGAAR